MLWRRLLYLVSLIGCVGFYIAYREWMAWLFLLTVLLLPWFCLLVSLPAMLTVRLSAFEDVALTVGQQMELKLKLRSPLPAPPLGWKYCIMSSYDRRKQNLKHENVFHAEHCGCYHVRIRSGWKYDYLGLFRLPFGRKLEQKIYVLPRRIRVENFPSLKRYLAAAWRPMPQTFSENHDLRAYRPGDSIRQIHWKLSSKTGKFILREPIVAQRGVMVLSLILGGDAEELDRKLGRLLYLSELLLAQDLPHEIHCLCDNGVEIFGISDERELRKTIMHLLTLPLTQKADMPPVKAAWHYHVGGERDEI